MDPALTFHPRDTFKRRRHNPDMKMGFAMAAIGAHRPGMPGMRKPMAPGELMQLQKPGARPMAAPPRRPAGADGEAGAAAGDGAARPMATPRATAKPCIARVMSFAFAKFVIKERQQSLHGLLFLLSRGFEFNLYTQARRQHHDTHDALGVDSAVVSAEPDFARKRAGQFGEFGRCPGVQAQFIADGHAGLNHDCVAAGFGEP